MKNESYIVSLISNPFIFHLPVSNELENFILQVKANNIFKREIKKLIKKKYKHFSLEKDYTEFNAY